MSNRELSDIEKAFVSKGTVRGNTLLLDSTYAIRLIEMAKKKRVEVLGIDSFQLSKTSTEPLMDHILDLSVNDGRVNDSWKIASSFIRQRSDKGFHFEVILEK